MTHNEENNMDFYKEIEQKIKQIATEQFGCDECKIVPEANLIEDLGADDLDIVEFIMGCEEEFDIFIEDKDANQIKTIGDMLQYIKTNIVVEKKSAQEVVLNNTSKYNYDLDYLFQDVDISKAELEKIIDEADKIISNANTEKDKLIEAYLKKVQCLQKLNKYPESKEFIDKLLILNPNMPEALVRLGNVYYENEYDFYYNKREYNSAIKQYEKAISIEENYAYAYYMRGLSYDNKEEYENALKDYNTAIRIMPDFTIAYSNRGWTYYSMGNYENAIDDAKRAIDIKANYDGAFNLWGAALSQIAKIKEDEKQFKDSSERYATATNINPKNNSAFRNWKITIDQLAEFKKDKKPFKNSVVKSAYNNYKTSILCAAYERLHLVLGDMQKFPDFDNEINNFLVQVSADKMILAEYYFIMSLLEFLNKEAPDYEHNLFVVVQLIEAGVKQEGQEEYQSDLDRLFDMLKVKDANHIALRHYEMFNFTASIKADEVIDCCRKHFSAIGNKGNIFKYTNNYADIEVLAKIIMRTFAKNKNKPNSHTELYDCLKKLYDESQKNGKPVSDTDIDSNLPEVNKLKQYYEIDDDKTNENAIIRDLYLLIQGLPDVEFDDEYESERKIKKVITRNTEYGILVDSGNKFLVDAAEDLDKKEHIESFNKCNKAIEEYTKAIEIDKNFLVANRCNCIAYAFKGIILETAKIKTEDADAEKSFEDAAKNFRIVKVDILKILKLSAGKKIVRIMLDEYGFFTETLREITDIDKKDKYKDIFIQSLEIISKLQILKDVEMPVSHYTSKSVSEILLFNDFGDSNIRSRSCFRLSSVNTSNDKSEGKILYQYLFPNADYLSQIEDYGAFAGCFTFTNDSLNQFRLYGKYQNEEGTGVSISLNEQFFSNELCIIVGTPIDNKYPLFRCIYIDPETNKVVSLGQKEEYVFYRDNKDVAEEEVKKYYQEYKSKIDKIQQEVCEELEKLKNQVENLDQNILYKLLLNLRYLVKHAAFKEEQECRIIQVEKLNSAEVQTDEKQCHYIDYLELSKDNVSEIVFAPKAKDIDKYKQHLARNNFNIKYYKSEAPLA